MFWLLHSEAFGRVERKIHKNQTATSSTLTEYTEASTEVGACQVPRWCEIHHPTIGWACSNIVSRTSFTFSPA